MDRDVERSSPLVCMSVWFLRWFPAAVSGSLAPQPFLLYGVHVV